jgi:hypothetical protein
VFGFRPLTACCGPTPRDGARERRSSKISERTRDAVAARGRAITKGWRSAKPPTRPTVALARCRHQRFTIRERSQTRVIGNNSGAPSCTVQAQTTRFSEEIWRRRPDLNRGWRFCRFRGFPFLTAGPAFWCVVPGRFYVVFGRVCSRIVLKFQPRTRLRPGHPGGPGGLAVPAGRQKVRIPASQPTQPHDTRPYSLFRKTLPCDIFSREYGR